MSFDYDRISPGVRDLVRELREVHDMVTIEHGDDPNPDGMRADRYVVMEVPSSEMMAATWRLALAYPDAHVECSWTPGETAEIALLPDGRPDD